MCRAPAAIQNNMGKRLRQRQKTQKYKKEIYHLGKSFVYAFRGFKFAVDNERNMRIHLSVALFVLEFSFLYGVTSSQFMILLILFGLVISAEMINTAIEALVNLQTVSYDALARIAKDVAAGAVLVLAGVAAAAGCIMFFDLEKLGAVAMLLMAHPVLIVLLTAQLIVAVLFIFFWNSRRSLFHKRK